MNSTNVLSIVAMLIANNREPASKALDQLAELEKKAGHWHIARELARFANLAANRSPMAMRMLPSAAVPEDPPEDQRFISTVPKRTLESLILAPPVALAVKGFLRGWRHRELLAQNGLPSAATLLLHGPTGNGKTSLAESIANALDLPLLTARGEQLIMSHIGESEKQIAAAFNAATKQPCVAFFDEADSFAFRRCESDEAAGWAQVRAVNQTLLEIERGKRSASLFVFATNGYKRLDPAFLRRMDGELELPAPDDDCRQKLIERFVERWPMIAGGGWERQARGAENMAAIERLAQEAAREIVLSQFA